MARHTSNEIKRVRQWALDNGIDIGPRRIPQEVWDQYLDEHGLQASNLDKCIVWDGFFNRDGYPIRTNKRLAITNLWKTYRGSIKPGFIPLLVCGHKWCVNLNHIKWVEPNRPIIKRCPKGHVMVGDNLYLRQDKSTIECRTCRNERSSKSRSKSLTTYQMAERCMRRHHIPQLVRAPDGSSICLECFKIDANHTCTCCGRSVGQLQTGICLYCEELCVAEWAALSGDWSTMMCLVQVQDHLSAETE